MKAARLQMFGLWIGLVGATGCSPKHPPIVFSPKAPPGVAAGPTSESVAEMGGGAAVVVGIETYPNAGVAPAKYAQKDARLFKDMLVKLMGIPEKNIFLIPEKEATAGTILERIQSACKLMPPGKGTFWFYYSGHGYFRLDYPEGQSEQVLEPVIMGQAASANTLKREAITHRELAQSVSTCGARAVVVLDACFSGKDKEGKDIFPDKKSSVFPADLVDPGPDHCPLHPQVAFWTAAQSHQFAGIIEWATEWWTIGGDREGYGQFTYLAVGGLNGWALDGSDDSEVTLGEANAFVARAMKHQLSEADEQQPHLDQCASHWPGSRGISRPSELPAVPPGPLETEQYHARLRPKWQEVEAYVKNEDNDSQDRLEKLNDFTKEAEHSFLYEREFKERVEYWAGQFSGWAGRLGVGAGVVGSELNREFDGTGGTFLSTPHVDLSLGRRLFSYFWPEVALDWSPIGSQRTIVGAGLRAYLGPAFFHTETRWMLDPIQTMGQLFGPGGDIPITGSLAATIELTYTLWFGATALVPIDLRLGLRYAF